MNPCEQKEIISEINKRLGDIEEMLSDVEVRNGGGRHITMRRKEFDQMIYDKTKELTLKDAGGKIMSGSRAITTIITALQLLILVYLAVVK